MRSSNYQKEIKYAYILKKFNYFFQQQRLKRQTTEFDTLTHRAINHSGYPTSIWGGELNIDPLTLPRLTDP